MESKEIEMKSTKLSHGTNKKDSQISCYSKKYIQKEPYIVKHATRKQRSRTTEMGTCNFCHYASLIHNNKRRGFTECEVLWDHGILDVSITCTAGKNLDFSQVVMFKCNVLQHLHLVTFANTRL